MALPVSARARAPQRIVHNDMSTNVAGAHRTKPAQSTRRPGQPASRQACRQNARWILAAEEPSSGKNVHSKAAPLNALTIVLGCRAFTTHENLLCTPSLMVALWITCPTPSEARAPAHA